MDKILGYTLAILFGLLLIVGFSALWTLPVYLGWNYLAPSLQLPRLGFCQVWVLMFLLHTLVKGVVTIRK